MRRLAPTVTALVLAAGLAACGGGSSDQGQGGGGTAAAPAAPPMTEADRQKILASLPAPYNGADLANGRAKWALCASCHTLTPGGPNMTGPNLHRIMGEKAASPRGTYKFSEPLKSSNLTWDAPTMDRWIENPRQMVPGTKMTFIGVKNPKDRVDLVAYLAVESGGPAT